MRLIFISLLFCLSQAFAIQWVNKIMDGEYVKEMMVFKNHLFTLSPKLKIHNIETPRSPKLVGVLDTIISFQKMRVDDKYAYLIEHYRKFYVVDIQAPSNPKIIGHYDFDGGSFRNLAVKDGYAYIAGADSGLLIFDIKDPKKPSFVGGHRSPNGYPITEVCVFDHYLAMATNRDPGPSSFLVILDISSPASPTLVDHPYLTSASYMKGLSIKHPFLYATRTLFGFTTFDLSDLDHIWHTANKDNFLTSARRTYVSNELIFATGGLLGIQIFQEKPIGSPEPISSYYPSGSALSMAIKDKTIYAGTAAGAHVLDASSLTNKPPVLNDQTRFAITQIIPVDTFLYVLSHTDLNSFNNSDETNPENLDRYSNVSRAVDMLMENDTAYIADAEDGLFILSAKQPRRINFVGNHRQVDSYRRIAKKGNYLYMGKGAAGIDIIDKSRPDKLKLVKNIPEHAGGEILIAGNIMYVCRSDSGLAVYDITSPENPKRLNTTQIRGNVMGIEVDEGLAYMTTYYHGVVVVDVSDPASPGVVGSYDTPGFAEDVLVHDKRLYVADGGSRIPVYDISEPKTLVFLGTLYTPGCSFRLAMGDKVLYSMNQYVGFTALDITDITPVIPKARAPFHGSNGPFSYAQFPHAMTFRLGERPVQQAVIFDIHGKIWTRLTPSPGAAKSIYWDKRSRAGAAAPRGVYFLKVNSNDRPQFFPFTLR